MAVRKVGGIVAEMLLDDKDFRAKLKRAGKYTETRAQSMRRAFNRVGKNIITAAAGAATGFSAAIAITSKRLDDLAKKSDRFAIPVDELQTLQYAAKQTGVQVGTLESSIQRLIRRSAQAADGGGAAAKAIKDLNINAKELSKLSPEKQFGLISDRLKDIEDSGDRARIAYEIFGRQGQEILNTLSLGSEGIAAMRKEMEGFGALLNRTDLAKVEAAGDNFTRLRTISEAFWDHLTIAASPVIEMITDKILDMVGAMGGMDKFAATVMDNLVMGAGKVADVFWGWSLAITAAQEGMMRLASMVVRAAREFEVFERWAELMDFASLKGEEIGLERAAIENLQKEGIIRELSGFDKFTRAIGGDELVWSPRELEFIAEEVEHLRKNINAMRGGPAQPHAPRLSQDFLKDLEKELTKGASDLQEKLAGKVETGRPSDRIDAQFRKLHLDFEKRAKETVDKIAATTTEPLETLGESAEKAAEELKKLSVADIARHGGDTPMGRLAQRIEKLEQEAVEQEARGRGRAAERSRERADSLREELELRQKGYSAEEIRSGEAARREAEKEAKTETEDSPAPEARTGRDVANDSDGKTSMLDQLVAIRRHLDNMATKLAIA